ncbi:MAG TPA: VCBS repeat-containing protein [Candidatus Saccharimonadales bacterium]|nr:VCBS repeat-containing protein [Candidatus Saccharimonadales bacterium]
MVARDVFKLFICLFLIAAYTTIARGSLLGPATNFPVTAGAPRALACGDLNNDGKMDLVTANFASSTVSVMMGSGSGAFTNFVSYSVGQSPVFVSLADFNHDGVLDIVTANYNNQSLSVLLGQGNGTFSPATNVSAGDRPNSVAVGDFNRDGNLDLAIANTTVSTVTVLLGNGNGTFVALGTNALAGGSVGSIATADFNGDGKLDLVTAQSDGAVAVLLGRGDGGFGSASLYPATFFYAAARNLSQAVIGDFNDDGRLDLVTANYVGANSTLLLGHGDGVFSAAATNGVAGGPSSIKVGDFNGDGELDFVTANGENNVSVRRGNGDGTFAASINFSLSTRPNFLVVADVNRDGKPDVITANETQGSVSVLLNDAIPTIKIRVAGSRPVLSWPDWPGYTLLSASNLTYVTTWLPITNGFTIIGTRRFLTNSASPGRQFFKLSPP